MNPKSFKNKNITIINKNFLNIFNKFVFVK